MKSEFSHPVRLFRAAIILCLALWLQACAESASTPSVKTPKGDLASGDLKSSLNENSELAALVPAVTVFSPGAVHLSVAELESLAPGAQVTAVEQSKPGEVPFLVAWPDSELRLIVGYSGDFKSYLSVALVPARRIRVDRDARDKLEALANSFSDMVWIQTVPRFDAEGKSRQFIRALAKKTGGFIYQPIAFFNSDGAPIWYGGGAQRF